MKRKKSEQKHWQAETENIGGHLGVNFSDDVGRRQDRRVGEV
jgi:hypothetical protein